jgi:hypothetical protein
LRDRALGHEALDEQYDRVERPDQALERRQGLRDVIAAVQALPERQRDAIVLRELEGRSYEEIAGELGVTGGAVRQLLNRARTTLRAAATAITPLGLLTRIPWAHPSDPVAERVADLCAGAGAGAVAAKVGVAALATGAVAGGGAVAPKDDEVDRASARDRTTERRAVQSRSETGPGGGEPAARTGTNAGGRNGGGQRDSSGPGSGDDRRVGDRSGSSESSGPGSGGDSEGEDRSGSNSGSGSGSSGSDSGSSGSGSSGSGISGSSGSGSGSGSGTSGSGSGSGDTSGSGSGSGSSGSGSGEEFDFSGSGSSGSG